MFGHLKWHIDPNIKSPYLDLTQHHIQPKVHIEQHIRIIDRYTYLNTNLEHFRFQISHVKNILTFKVCV